MSISKIPAEMFVYILSFLSRPADLGRCQRINSVWKKTIEEHKELWKNLLMKLNPQISVSEDPKRDLILFVTSARKAHTVTHLATETFKGLIHPVAAFSSYTLKGLFGLG